MKKLVILVILLSLVAAVFAERKALVIANAAYDKVTLQSPIADADSMEAALHKLHFVVQRFNNLKLSGMQAAVDTFAVKIKSTDEVIFYYSGQGISAEQVNYLVPSGCNLSTTQVFSQTAYSLNTLAQKLRTAKTSIIILEASRTWANVGEKAAAKPFTSINSASPKQVIITSAQPASVIQNSNLARSVFTDAFIRLSSKSEENFNLLFPKIVAEVKAKTNNAQITWISGTLASEFKCVNEEVKLYWHRMQMRGIEGGGSISW